MKRILLTGLAVLMVALSAAPATASNHTGLKVTFNGHKVSFDVQPMVESGRTLVPFRAIFEKMGADVQFDSATRKITATRGDKTITLTIGSTTATVDGQTKTLDVAPKIVNDRTVVPLRFIGEAMGASVNYDGANQMISIVDKAFPKRGGTVTMAIFSSWKDSFSPFNIPNDIYTGYVTNGIYSGVWYYNDKVNPTPDIATHWDISSDSKTVTYYLRKDVKFHDGTPVTAHDLARSAYITRHPDYKGTLGSAAKNLGGYAKYQETRNRADLWGVKVIDDYTISFTAEQVDAAFFPSTAVGAVHPTYDKVPVADIGTSRDPMNAFPIGTGPFKWAEYKEGQYIAWTKNADFYGGEVYIDKVIWKVQPAATVVAALTQGSVDWSEQVSINDVDGLSKLSHIKVVEYAGASYQVMNINNRNFPLSDKRMRQALAYAIDRQAIIQNILKNHASPMNAPIHPLNWAYNNNLPTYAKDLNKSKALIESLGYTMGSDGYYKDSKGARLKLRLNYPTGNVAREQAAPVVQQMLKEVGIEIELIKSDFASMLATIRDSDKHDWDLSFSGWSLGNPDPDPRQLYAKDSIGPGKSNMAGWTTERSEELLTKAVRTLDLEERIEFYTEWQELFAEEMPNLALYAQNKIDAVNVKIQNYKPHPYSYGMLWNMDEWWLK